MVFCEGYPPLVGLLPGDCCVHQTSQPVASYTILNRDGHIWTNSFITAYNNTDVRCCIKISHHIDITWWTMTSQITRNSTVVFRLNKGDIKAQHYWPFVRGIHRYLIIILIIITSVIIFIIIITVIITIIIIIFNYHHYYYCCCSCHYQYYYHHVIFGIFNHHYCMWA